MTPQAITLLFSLAELSSTGWVTSPCESSRIELRRVAAKLPGFNVHERKRYFSGNCAADASSRGVDAGDFPKGQLTGHGNLVAATNYERVDALGRVMWCGRAWMDWWGMPLFLTPTDLAGRESR